MCAFGESTKKTNAPLWGFLLLGLAAGFASTLFGIGGGLVMVPALTLLFGLGIKEAVAVSLAGIIPISAVGLTTEAVTYGENISWITALFIACGSLAGTRVGSIIVKRIKERQLRILFAFFVLIAAGKMFGFPRFEGEAAGLSWDVHGVLYPLGAMGTGLLAGTCAVLFGVGGGIIVVPFLTFFFDGFDFHQARATSLAVILPTSIAGALLHKKLENVRWYAVQRLVPLALVGAGAGVLVANRMESQLLKTIFGVLLVVSGLRLFFKNRR